MVLRLLMVLLLLGCGAGARGADGAASFTGHCASCHGLDGKARTPAGKKLGAKDLAVSTLADAVIEHQILEGVTDAKGVARMPPFKERLNAGEVGALVAYVKTFRR